MLPLPMPALVVTGSKGKGTIATYAAATLAAAGLRVGTVMSPSVLTNRERARVNGRALSAAEYAALSARIDGAVRAAGDAVDGYLSPTGLFTLAGVRHLCDAGCEVAVLEGGLGGRSDEVSLFPARVLALGAIFGEHLGILGDTIEDVARDKVALAVRETAAIVSVAQRAEVAPIARAAADALGLRLDVIGGDALPDVAAPAGLSRANAAVGVRAAHALLATMGLAPPSLDALRAVAASIRLPGRLSVHADDAGRTWILDAAIEQVGVADALAWCDARGGADLVLLSLPDEKDVRGVDQVLRGRRVVPVAVPSPHIHFARPSAFGPHVPIDAVDLGDARRILALGTWSFIAFALERLGVSTEVLFDPPR